MLSHKKQDGFTLIELLIAIVIIGILSLGLVTFTTNALRQYLDLQRDATAFSDLSQQSQRVTNVLRGATDITEASNNQIEVYAYFFPNNQYVSLIKYYLNAEGTALYADVTPMTSNPPVGVPIPAQKKTYTIIPYTQAQTINLFEYVDASGADLVTPIAELSSIKGIRINLQTPTYNKQDSGSQTITTEVSLRNRKSNL